MVELVLEQVLETTDTIVQELLATGEFGQCTFKDVMLRVDTRLDLPRGTLLRYEHKSTVKELVKGLVLQAEKIDDEPSPPPKMRATRPGPGSGGKSTKRRKTNDKAGGDREGSDDGPEVKKAKKSGSTSKVKAKEVIIHKVTKSVTKKSSIKLKASEKTPKPAISAELVDSDLDDMDPGPSTSKPPASTSSPKKSKQKLLESDDEDDTASSPRPTKPKPSQPKRLNAGQIPVVKNVADDSESELSVLLDDEPPKRQRKSKGEKEETKPKGTRQKKEKKELSKDEETIKRLKSLVVACGVRKVWSKEFKDLANTHAQVKRLKSILTELGMTGRMSMEQAKAIRAKREFAQELEDIKDFEKKVVGRSGGRSSRNKLGSERKDVESSDEDEDEDEDDDEEDEKPCKKRTNARNSISAFLEDQSDED